MRKLLTLIIPVLCLLAGACTGLSSGRAEGNTSQRIDAYVKELIELNEVPGLAFAVIRNGKVVQEHYYGVTDTATQTQVNSDTVFRIYSLSKLMTAVAVFNLIEQGKLHLLTSLSQFFNDIPDDWKTVTIGHLLAHASGLPDIRTLIDELADTSLSDDDFFKLIYAQDRQYPTGDDWSYTQTNYLLLKRIIEDLTHEKFESYIRAQQFSFIDADRVIYSSNDFDNIAQRASVYKYNAEINKHEQKLENYGPRNNVLAGLNLTLTDLIRWNADLDNGRFIRDNTRDVMWTPFAYIKSDEKFLYGWGVYPVADQVSYGFSGGGVSALRKFPHHDLTIIVLTNGFKYYPVHNTLINQVAGMIDPALENKPVVLARLYQHDYLKTRTLNIETCYDQTISMHPDLDPAEVMTSFAYKLFDIREPVHATNVFLEITRRNPASISALENLGQAYLSQGNMQSALTTFERVLALDPENAGTQKMLRGIRQKL